MRRALVFAALAAAGCGGGSNAVGECGADALTLRRLTQTEYNNTVRDLLGDTSGPATGFPADSRNLGFDNNQVTLSMPPLLVAGYEGAAERLIEDAWTRDATVSPTAWLRVCDPAPGEEATCASQIVGRFARRAWRRPVADDELAPLLALESASAAAGDDFATSVQLALRAILISPNFVYRTELDTPIGQPLGSHSLAARLSYFLWSSMPDDALSAKADDGTLATPAVLEAEVRRMLADPKAHALIDSFAAQWLDTMDVPLISPDPMLFPTITTSLKQAMHDEMTLFFTEFLQQQHNALDMVDANFTYVNEELARFYGLSGVSGAAMQRVQLPTGSHRGGLLTQAGFLALTSLSTRTSVVRRGKWVLGQLLCEAPPPPPPNVPPFPTSAPPGSTQRQILDAHASSPACSSCHRLMDPIGFALENFDATGQYRTQDNGAPIDATGSFDGTTFNGAAELAQVVKSDSSFPACMASNVYGYALGRTPVSGDQPALAQITQKFLSGGAQWLELFVGVATSSAFTQRCPPEASNSGQ